MASTTAGKEFWTPEMVERAKALWLDGKSASEIAKTLGAVSRSSVIGKLNRAKVGLRAQPAKPEKRQKVKAAAPKVAPPKAPAVKRAPNQNGGLAFGPRTLVTDARPAPAEIRRDAFSPLPGLEPVPFIERRNTQCRWPVGGSGAEMLCCGATAFGNYCAAHTAMAAPAAGIRERLDERLGVPKPRRAA